MPYRVYVCFWHFLSCTNLQIVNVDVVRERERERERERAKSIFEIGDLSCICVHCGITSASVSHKQVELKFKTSTHQMAN